MEYSREEIVKYFYETKRKLGRVPKVKEFKLISPVRRNWGNYNAFLKDIGEKTLNERTKEKYINQVKKFVDDNGRKPLSAEFSKNMLTIVRIFGYWNNLLLEAGIKEIRIVNRSNMTDDELLEYYINLCNKENRLITSKELDKNPVYLNSHIFGSKFGSFGEFLKVTINDERLKIKDKKCKIRTEKYTQEELAYHIKQYLESETIITIRTFKQYLKVNKLASINTYKNRFRTRSFKELIKV